jgi:hypothetical protein
MEGVHARPSSKVQASKEEEKESARISSPSARSSTIMHVPEEAINWLFVILDA